jgi:hypothetical protein
LRKYFIYFVFIISFLFIPINIEAYFCDYNELARLKNIASNINVSYDYIEQEDKMVYTIFFNNIQDGVTIKNVNGEVLTNIVEDRVIINDYISDGVDVFTVNGEVPFCKSGELSKIYLNLPFYNKFYKLPVCNNLDYEYCDRFFRHSLSEETFIARVNEYKKEINDDKEKETIKKYWFEYINEYYYYTLILIIASSSYAIYVLIKKDDFDLETK